MFAAGARSVLQDGLGVYGVLDVSGVSGAFGAVDETALLDGVLVAFDITSSLLLFLSDDFDLSDIFEIFDKFNLLMILGRRYV